jgi:hypothetical protein
MLEESIQGVLDLREREPKSCPVCGTAGKTLIIPEDLPYEEAKNYRGPKVCMSCARQTRFKSLPTLDLGGVA